MADGEAAAAIGRTMREDAVLEAGALARLAVAIGAAADHVPALAHWAWFLDLPADDAIGADGHPRRGGFLPALPHLPRRMFAAADIVFDAPLAIGAPATLETRIADVRETQGRSGTLAFVTVARTLSQAGEACVRETRTLVYRGDGAPTPLPAETGAGGWRPDPVALFRFSAATFNAHRIHYDAAYAREVEGYPALVVHGPFTAMRLAEMAAARGALAAFSFRAQAPLFVDQPVTLRAAEEAGDGAGHGGAFEAVRCDGAVAMAARASW